MTRNAPLVVWGKRQINRSGSTGPAHQTVFMVRCGKLAKYPTTPVSRHELRGQEEINRQDHRQIGRPWLPAFV